MDIRAKDFVLMPRHLRKFNHAQIEFFDGKKGKLFYPYVMMREDRTIVPVMIEKRDNYERIHKVYVGRQLVAERKTSRAQLQSTGTTGRG